MNTETTYLLEFIPTEEPQINWKPEYQHYATLEDVEACVRINKRAWRSWSIYEKKSSGPNA